MPADNAPPSLIQRSTLYHADGRELLVYGELTATAALPHDDGAGPVDVGLHRRLDVLTDQWVAISPSRNTRPLQQAHDAQPTCPLCPGGPEIPFPYAAAVFENRFPSLRTGETPPTVAGGATAASDGRCEVVCYTSRHDAAFGSLVSSELGCLMAIWQERSTALWAREEHAAVLIFENRGVAVGATLSHPHGQIYALDHIPPYVLTRLAASRGARARTGTCSSCELAERDADSARALRTSDRFVSSVPFAPRWPYEVHVRARQHGVRRLGDLDRGGLAELATHLRDVVVRYDALFGFELPYMLVFREAPHGADDWHLAVELLPPHRGPEKLKVRASVETALGLFINDTLPENSAMQLLQADVADHPVGVVEIPAIGPTRLRP